MSLGAPAAALMAELEAKPGAVAAPLPSAPDVPIEEVCRLAAHCYEQVCPGSPESRRRNFRLYRSDVAENRRRGDKKLAEKRRRSAFALWKPPACSAYVQFNIC